MSVNPTPFITVGDAAVGTAAPSSGGGLTGINELRVTWGRASILDQPTPARCTVTVLDTTPGATFARRTDLRGREVQAGYVTVNASGDPTATLNFRGRVTDTAARPRRSGGFYVDVTCSSKEVDAANYTAPEGTSWPAETMGARLARIVALLPAGLFAGGVQLPTRAAVGLDSTSGLDFADYPVAAADVGGQDALSLLQSLWRSTFPVPLVYDPTTDGLAFIRSRRHYVDTTAGGSIVGQLIASPARAGRYVAAPYTSLSVPLDAGRVEFDGPLAQPMESSATRVEVAYTLPGTTTRATAGVVVPGSPAETTSGRRTLSVDSILADAGWAAQLAQQWTFVAAQQAMPALHDPITYRPGRDGGFADDAAAGALLAGQERPAELFLGGSWLTLLGARPVVSVIGGTITYAGGEWALSLNTAPVTVDTPTARPLTPATAAASAAVTLADIDRSVSVGDLEHVQIGAGFTYSTQPWGTA